MNTAAKHLDIKKIRSEINDLKKSMLNFKFQKSSGQLEKTSEIKKTRKKIARLKTQINKKSDLNKLYDSFHNTILNCIVYENCKRKKNEPKMPYITKTILEQGKTVNKARKKFIK